MHWEKIVGERNPSETELSWNNQYADYLCSSIKQGETRNILEILKNYDTGFTGEFKKTNFEWFYRFFIGVGIEYARKRWEKAIWNLCRDTEQELAIAIFQSIKDIPIRCLIREIHNESTRLKGHTSKEKYECYESQFLKNPVYIRKLCEKYQEMERILILRIYQTVKEMGKVLESLIKDKKIICEQITGKKLFKSVVSIHYGMSDFHHGGKSVIFLQLDNGYKIIYKPRSLEKKKQYTYLLNWFYRKQQLQCNARNWIDRGMYGWDQYISPKPCLDESEVRRYYQRMGIILFLCYLTNTTDIHGENLIADGEFPELLDLETMPGNIGRTDDQCGRMNTVMQTGILPTFYWNKQNLGEICALHSSEVYETPLLPTIINGYTSDIQIRYEKKKNFLKGSLVRLNGKSVCVQKYIESLCFGFVQAYRTALNYQKELSELLIHLCSGKSRYLLRHTQQYSMYFNVSLFPEFLKNTTDRIHLFYVLKKNRNVVSNPVIFQYELKSALNLDIPLYYSKVDSNSLFTADESEICSWFPQTIKDQLRKNQKYLSEKDLALEEMLIRLSVSYGFPETEGNCFCKKRSFQISQDYLNWLAEHMLQMQNEDGTWKSIIYCENTWKIERAGTDLYNGISGIALFWAIVSMKMKEYRSICTQTCHQMTEYTDRIAQGSMEPFSKETGMMAGEGSVVYAYLLLWKILGEKRYLEYACRHATIVHQMIEQDQSYDLMYGNAGWIVVLIKLYQETEEIKYLEWAVKTGEILWKSVTIISHASREDEAGWICRGADRPLAGMSHGNSGFILAYGYLMEYTKIEIYRGRIDKLLNYEDSLFSEKDGNWKDLRNKDGKSLMNAWCHGGGGVLLSRLRLKQTEFFCEDSRVNEDIGRGIQCLLPRESDKGFCICHGISGSYLILKICKKLLNLPEAESEMERIKQQILNTKQIPISEFYSTSFMLGIAGTALALTEIEEDFLW